MIEYIDGDMIITGSEAMDFVKNAVHPSAESIARRDAFFEELDAYMSIECVGSEMFIGVLDLEIKNRDLHICRCLPAAMGESTPAKI